MNRLKGMKQLFNKRKPLNERRGIVFRLLYFLHYKAFALTKWTSERLANNHGSVTRYHIETYDYFVRQSQQHPNWWHYKPWWNKKDRNPIWEHKWSHGEDRCRNKFCKIHNEDGHMS